METINEITFEKLKKIDYEILRLEKALSPWQLMAEIWSLKKQLDCVSVNGEIVPDTDWTPEIDNLLLDNTPVLGEYHYAIHQSIVEKERLLQEAGFTLSRYADVLFQVEYIREELKRLHNIRRKDFEETLEEKTLAVHDTQETENPKQAKKLSGKKQHYADPKELDQFLMDIIKRYGDKPLKVLVNTAMIEMVGRKLFLKENGKLKYAEGTIRKKLSELK